MMGPSRIVSTRSPQREKLRTGAMLKLELGKIHSPRTFRSRTGKKRKYYLRELIGRAHTWRRFPKGPSAAVRERIDTKLAHRKGPVFRFDYFLSRAGSHGLGQRTRYCRRTRPAQPARQHGIVCARHKRTSNPLEYDLLFERF